MLEHDRSFRGIGTAMATISAIVIAIIGSFYVGFNYSKAGNQEALEVHESAQ